MKTRWLVVWCAICLAALGDGAQLLACGDKALVPSRARRFNLTPSVRRQVNILLVLKPDSSLAGLSSRLSFDADMKKAGYQVTLATTDEEREKYIRTVDVVVVDVEEIVRGSAPASSAAVLAVAVNSSKADIKSAKGKYSSLVKSPSRSDTLIARLDDIVASRRKKV